MPTPLQGLFSTIDSVRGIATSFGIRPFRIFVRVATWTGTEPYSGVQSNVDTELLPRPRVREMSSKGSVVRQNATEGGLNTDADLRIDQISPTSALSTLLPTLAANQRMYLVLSPVDGNEASEQLYVLKAGPFKHLMEWTLDLTKAEG